ncbi:AGE family epimerase/isomerase [Aeromicrobium stalagmiti]|uniref:AGE family epimerase/isomerase n=1 Tax=Aeromicrobium stalagmiti TaxID=2738988 RepID=UPI001569A6AC|nr:AGE family epimerase/isomerase [Aeromicrobium stalagmiti]NRQ48800.1 AGE family epimerase/isomerase [Aeromicrobium stalagmiti]
MTDDSPGSATWRHSARADLLAFARRSERSDGGFIWLDDSGNPDPDKHLELWINARMTYVFALAHLAGASDVLRLVEHGVTALSTLFHDDVNGGWYDEVDFDGVPADTDKRCYGHAHVLLAATVAVRAGAEGAKALLDEAADVHARHFWDAESGRCVEEISEDWTKVDNYRGANSNMHTVEAYLFAADVTGQPVWEQRALAICERIIGIHARSHGWRIPEHYDHDWTPVPEFNLESPADPFRPFGATPGHAFEWSRLILQLEAGLDDPKPWMREAAEALFAQAVEDTAEDDTPGLAYTTDWHGEPIVRERFHWVISEAVLAAEALHTATGKALYAGLASRWWSEIAAHFVDDTTGSWHHELAPSMRQSTRTWRGKPDAYHAFNALTLPDLPLSPSPAMTLGAAS